ncbi:TspO/MBR family protein [Zavarzinia sp. CC-PAN008]|uniref:TspO/MBR family protein n=1 Tax=Zavarzinia sp. CC-PAN008 TaxID=3243332 RepID=UPI003F7477DD
MTTAAAAYPQRRRVEIIVAAAAAIVTAGLGGLATDIGPWYYSLKVPDWKPPDWAFGPIWTTIFILAAIASVLAWRGARSAGERSRVLVLFGVNYALNLLWSVLFFTLKRPDWALVEVAFLWLSIVALVVGLYRLSRLASLLIVPYLAWVSLASVLTWWIVQNNGPFA